VSATKVDLSEFFKLSRPRTPPCRLGPVLAELSPEEMTQWEAALEADANVITNQALAMWLDRHVKDHTVNWQNCLSHRSKKCTCFSE